MNSRILIIVAIMAMLAGVFGWKFMNPSLNPETLNATVFPQSRVLNWPELTTHEGKEFDLRQAESKWTLVFFGYTECRYICAPTLNTLNQVWKQLSDTPEAIDNLQLYFVSLDPMRDKPAALKAWVTQFNKDFIGLTGSQAGIDQLSKQLFVANQRIDNKDGSYDFDHSGTVILLNRQHHAYGVYTTPLDPGKIAADMRQLHAH